MNIPLLHRLRDAQGAFVSIAELGDGEAFDSVQTDLDELERFGFVLESHPYRGVAYRGPAARLCPDQIEHELGTRRVGRRIAVWNRVISTNDLAANAAASKANEGLVILAEEQTAGRGRRGRQWVAPTGSSLLMSVLLFPSESLAEAGWLTALGAVAVAEVVAAWTGLDARIKWPNDVRIAGRKIAGILVERGEGAVIGIGLNANLSQADFPTELHETATSLRILMGETVDRSELVRALIRRLDAWYDRGWSLGPDALNPAWRDRSEHLGQMVEVATPSGSHVGRLVDLDLRRGLTLAESDQDGRARQFSIRDVLTLTPCNDGAGPGPNAPIVAP
ncbi:biotin--[acetyl-CoA-carboxylase] ligase [Singulisphaera sp. GP187]|uniref:biotin--[acetyl-CoA-carboxylase] ligase n=1 Tax=Singulisphaera sp. GP187 TaxID=1882752 RepID=UPI0020B10918|nr:biotin--[acetyl-CoA-carboxylase] ligase [Singulisphaera sp. GP187]